MPNAKKAPSTDVRSFVPRHIGPSDAETQAMHARRAYELVQKFLSLL